VVECFFWYWLTWVVPDKGPLNDCVCVCVCVCAISIVSLLVKLHFFFLKSTLTDGLLGSRVVSVLDSGTVGPGFKLHPRRCWVTVLGKLFTPIVHQAAKLVAALLKVARVTAGLAAESNGSLLLGL